MHPRIEINFSKEQLSSLINKNFETNRLLAAHKNSDGMILDAVADFEVDGEVDPETIALCLKNPNITVNIIKKYGATNWGVVVKNPAFNLLLIEGKIEPNKLYGLLKSRDCPEDIINSVAAGSNEISKYYLLRNPVINELIRENIIKDSLSMMFYRLDLAIENTERQEIKKHLEDLRRLPRIVFWPAYIDSPIQPCKLEDRLSDQLIYGCPFTSYRWPWPKNESEVAKQPLLQLNLENAGEKLGLKLGKGILQVWIDSVDELAIQGPESNAEFRIIPSADFADPLEVMSLKEACWLEHQDGYIAYEYQSSPRIKWIPVGFQLPLLELPVDGLTDKEVIDYWNELKPDQGFDITDGLQLGGYPQFGTNYDDLFHGQFSRDFESGIYLIFHILCTESDLHIGLALFAKIQEDGEVSFECTYSGYAH